jgi:hypothetical protein
MDAGRRKSERGLRPTVVAAGVTPATAGNKTAYDKGAGDKRAYYLRERMGTKG